MSKEIENIRNEKYESLIEDCNAIIIESAFVSRWALVEGSHKLGERIRQDCPKPKKDETRKDGIVKLLQGLAVDLQKSERMLWYAVQIYDKYPELGQIPEGKNITLNKLITKYLPAPKEERGVKIDLPKGKYNIVYIDPPWDIGSMVLEKWESPLRDKYKTLNKEEIQEYTDKNGKKLYDIFSEECAIFMWVTQTKLPEALEIMNYWEFKYHITITWDKGGGWSANGFYRNTELLLFGYKGKLSNLIKQSGEFIPTLISEKKTEHSKKPEIVYKLIENNTIGKKVECFARIKRPGWESWGDQI